MDVNKIMAYEDGGMSHEEEVQMFQEAINSGMAWKLQGSYGRRAMESIEAGECMLGEEPQVDYWGNRIPSRYEVKKGTKGSKEYCEEMQRKRA